LKLLECLTRPRPVLLESPCHPCAVFLKRRLGRFRSFIDGVSINDWRFFANE
jgi:hypothetical protein